VYGIKAGIKQDYNFQVFIHLNGSDEV